MNKPAAPKPPASKPRVADAPLSHRDTPLSIDLLRAREMVMRPMRPVLAGFGVTEQQWRLLRALQALGPLEVKALAFYACIQPASASRIVAGLEANGLVSRRTPPEDRRRSELALSAEATALLDKIAPHARAVNQQIAATVGAGKIEEMQTMLREFIDLLWTDFDP